LEILQVKVAVVGDGTVGKTSLVNRFTGKTSLMEQFLPESYKMTIGVNIVVYKIETTNGKKINFAIWDLGGQPRFNVVRSQFYKGTRLIMYVYDISNKESFDNLTKWFQEVHKSYDQSNYEGLLVGNKLDLVEFRVIDFETAKSFAEARGFKYLETSAKDGTGTIELVEMLTDCVVERPSQKSMELEVLSNQYFCI